MFISRLVCLRKWKLDEELFVIKRKGLQPNHNVFATLPALDHEIGQYVTVMPNDDCQFDDLISVYACSLW